MTTVFFPKFTLTRLDSNLDVYISSLYYMLLSYSHVFILIKNFKLLASVRLSQLESIYI